MTFRKTNLFLSSVEGLCCLGNSLYFYLVTGTTLHKDVTFKLLHIFKYIFLF
jgi:hypothetical protein